MSLSHMYKKIMLLIYVSNTDRPLYLEISNLFHRGNFDIHLHSPTITNGITSLKTTYKKLCTYGSAVYCEPPRNP